MNIIQTGFNGLVIIEPKVIEDSRGYFYEAFNHRKLLELGISMDCVQINQSRSKYGVIRGLHFQNAPYCQAKLVRVLSGRIYDVAVDLREEEPTYRQYCGFELSSDNKRQLLVPKGFAHGFLVLSEFAEIIYRCDEYYKPESEGGIRFDDPDLNIQWPNIDQDFTISDKDLHLPFLSAAKFNFNS